ncbi:MAG: hypothetical protein JWM47_4523 [Acidimicrobiales bacterium]|nr:hypothetical protein [Acidimicrobiales bacterium]
MPEWVYVLIYGVAGAFVWRRVAWFVYREERSRWRGDVVDWDAFALAQVVGFLGAMFWPIVALGMAIRELGARNESFLMAAFMSAPKSAREKERIASLERQAKDRERHISELEQKLEVA